VQAHQGQLLGSPVSHLGRPCAPQVGQEFDCLALTLEMPFKDSAELPEPVHGYTPDRCRGLGAAFLTALLEVVPSLR